MTIDCGGVFKAQFQGLSYVQTSALYTTGQVKLRYTPDVAGQTAQETVAFAPTVKLAPGLIAQAVSGSARLQLGSLVLQDQSGALRATDPATGATTTYGTLDAATATATLTNWPAGAPGTLTRQAMTVVTGQALTDEIVFRTAAAPLRPGTLILQFRAGASDPVTTITVPSSGKIETSTVQGFVDHQTGIVRMRFGQTVTAAGNETQPWYSAQAVRDNGTIFKPLPVVADSIRYAAVAYTYIPLDKSILGIDPVRLPSDGRVPIFRVGDVAVVHHDASQTVTSLATPQTINLGRTRLSRVWIFDEGDADKRIDTARYTVDLDAGSVTLTNTVGLVGPLRIEHRIEDMALVSDVQISGDITLTKQITHDYPAGSGISSALVIGDMQARATPPFDQQTWTNVWSDTLIGSPTTAEFNAAQYPIEVSNIGAIQERWALIFDTPTQVRVVGESVGQIAVASIASDISPINPATGAPYFTIRAAGWGGGWSSGNVLRFNTVAANFPVWLARTVKQGPGFEGGDRFRVQIRGDAN